MQTVTRRKAFETNSSSTHSFSISLDQPSSDLLDKSRAKTPIEKLGFIHKSDLLVVKGYNCSSAPRDIMSRLAFLACFDNPKEAGSDRYVDPQLIVEAIAWLSSTPIDSNDIFILGGKVGFDYYVESLNDDRIEEGLTEGGSAQNTLEWVVNFALHAYCHNEIGYDG